jgi:hypothetical protein
MMQVPRLLEVEPLDPLDSLDCVEVVSLITRSSSPAEINSFSLVRGFHEGQGYIRLGNLITDTDILSVLPRAYATSLSRLAAPSAVRFVTKKLAKSTASWSESISHRPSQAIITN